MGSWLSTPAVEDDNSQPSNNGQPPNPAENRPRTSVATRTFRSDIQPWHSSPELNALVRAYHDTNGRQPQGIDEARKVHTRYMNEIIAFLRSKKCCSRVEYTGSTYEGVKVAKNPDNEDLEFDVMVVMEGGAQLSAEDVDKPGFVQLKPRRKHDFASLPGLLSDIKYYSDREEMYVDAQKLYNKFFGLIQCCVNDSKEMNGNVKLVKHGPATQIDVYRTNEATGTKSKFYSVDIVLAFEIGSGDIFVAKQAVKDQESKQMTSCWWRKSFSVAEKQKLEVADRGNECRKMVFRVLKVIRNREATLSKLTSYHLKTVLFREMDKPGLTWAFPDDIGKRLMGVLEELDRELCDGCIPHYYVHGIDLLEGVAKITISNIQTRISRLRMSEIEMRRILTLKPAL